ncbi:MAG TPA: S8 family serine peptidase [Chthoniobacterales bacterium]|jgi:subtilisin family serine protease
MNTHIFASRLRQRLACLLLFAAAGVAGLAAINSSRALSRSSAATEAAALRKIAPWVTAHTADGRQAEFIVVLNDQADLSGAAALQTKRAKGRFVRDALWSKKQATQGPVLQWLNDHHLEHRSFYIVNAVWVKGRAEDALALAERPDIARVEGNPEVRNYPNPLPAVPAPSQPNEPDTVEQGIAYTHAPDVWAMGFTGQGIVIGDGDTGFRWTHNAIKPHYRGWNGVTADHDYNWHDAIHTGGGICGPNSPQPCDDTGHGTHTMGTTVGDDGSGNQIGMAPGAQCIGCRNMDQGNGTPARYMECFEFFLAPYPVNGTPAQGDPSKAPDITTNSWECPPSEGCSSQTLQQTVEAQRAAGIMCVVAAQNSGPSCSTVQNPPGIYDAAYSIGALNNGTDTIASFSSRGPVTADGSMRLKPDLAAPGTNVRSSYNSSDTSFAFLSGTSMATPHVAGAVALLWSAHPELRNDIDATENVLNSSAHHILSNACDSGPPTTPNNTYGNGRVDILAAVQQAPAFQLTSAASVQMHGAQTFGVPLPLTSEPGVECRSTGGHETLVFTFNDTVVSGSATLTSGTGTVAMTSFSGNTMTVSLTNVANVQQIALTLSGVTSASSQTLADTTVRMNVLIGDANADKSVSQLDVSLTKSQAGMALTNSNFREDVNVDGAISQPDVSLTKSKSGTGIP